MRSLVQSSPDGRITLATNPAVGASAQVVKFTTTGGEFERVCIPTEVGDTIMSGAIEVWGNGAMDPLIDLKVRDKNDALVQFVAQSSSFNLPASWTNVSIVNQVSTRTLLATDVLCLDFGFTTSPGSLYLNNLYLTFVH